MTKVKKLTTKEITLSFLGSIIAFLIFAIYKQNNILDNPFQIVPILSAGFFVTLISIRLKQKNKKKTKGKKKKNLNKDFFVKTLLSTIFILILILIIQNNFKKMQNNEYIYEESIDENNVFYEENENAPAEKIAPETCESGYNKCGNDCRICGDTTAVFCCDNSGDSWCCSSEYDCDYSGKNCKIPDKYKFILDEFEKYVSTYNNDIDKISKILEKYSQAEDINTMIEITNEYINTFNYQIKHIEMFETFLEKNENILKKYNVDTYDWKIHLSDSKITSENNIKIMKQNIENYLAHQEQLNKEQEEQIASVLKILKLLII